LLHLHLRPINVVV